MRQVDSRGIAFDISASESPIARSSSAVAAADLFASRRPVAATKRDLPVASTPDSARCRPLSTSRPSRESIEANSFGKRFMARRAS